MPVTDADRLCAAEIGRRFAKWTERQIEMTLAGEGDEAGIIQLISAHREAGARAERVRIIRALGIYPEWCDGWGLTKNLNMAVRVAAECARMVRALPDDLPADDEDAGDKITKAIRAVSDQERA